MNLYPSLLTSSVKEYQSQLSLIDESKIIEVIQVDVIDGQFIENITLTPLDLAEIEHGELQLDFHLMTEEPMDYVLELIPLKDQLRVRAIIAQVERMSSQANFLHEVQVQNWKTGLSLDLYTPVEAVDEESWAELDIVQLMSIEAGFQGQEFNHQVLKKIKQIRDLAQDRLEIIIDGGVKKELIPLLVDQGVGGIVVGSGFWKDSDPVDAIKEYSGLLS